MRLLPKFFPCFLVLSLAFTGCETDKSNPVGAGLIGRDPGAVVEMPPVEMRSGTSFQELVLPIVLGEREELLVGQMNGFVYRSLLRFRVPADSLARASGGTRASDFVADTLRVRLGIRSARFLDNVGVGALNPTTPWREVQTFVDSLTLVEKSVDATPIADALIQVHGDSILQIDLPVSHFIASQTADPISPVIDVMLAPNVTGDFLLDLVAREAEGALIDNRPPGLELDYRVGNTPGRFEAFSSADTYWGARVNGGPPDDLLILAKGTFYGAILNFDIPKTIPEGATFNSAHLELDLDLDRSYFRDFPIEIYHVQFRPAQNDTLYTRYTGEVDLLPDSPRFAFNQALVQAWMTGAQVNQGMALRPLGSPGDMTWMVIKGARMVLVYSLPPEL